MDIRDDCCAFQDKISIVYVVLQRSMRHAGRSYRPPSAGLFHQSINVGQLVSVRECWQSSFADDLVDFDLGFELYLVDLSIDGGFLCEANFTRTSGCIDMARKNVLRAAAV